jgi:hypothetical protein
VEQKVKEGGKSIPYLPWHLVVMDLVAECAASDRLCVRNADYCNGSSCATIAARRRAAKRLIYHSLFYYITCGLINLNLKNRPTAVACDE